MGNTTDYHILPVGDSALTVVFGNEIDPKISAVVRAARMNIEEAQIEGVVELVQTYASLMVHYNPMLIEYGELLEKLRFELDRIDTSKGNTIKRTVEIPVCYGGEFGPDLHTVSKHTGLRTDEVIKRHCTPEYQIYMLGFMPGFVYLGGMDKSISTPRLKDPRERLEKGSVGIAGDQTGIYPLVSPGGWQIIGRTPVNTYDHDREKPILYEAGEFIRFRAIDLDEYNAIEKEVAEGTYKYKWTEEDL